ncbi:hypothetical protein [Pseudomonas phage Eisa9]|uniref:Uncharacterized protein n=1 Tax=Pseudomonas phage Eisa9 TaxID=2900148 RepID=A0AAE9C8Y7_9CAUD|nr:hypothetical protein [Pseudomonas phage Eisa9]
MSGKPYCLELQVLITTQDLDNPGPLNIGDAMFISEPAGLLRGTEQDGFGVLSDAGFDESTGVDTALSVQHEGAMLAAGYLMMECDE